MIMEGGSIMEHTPFNTSVITSTNTVTANEIFEHSLADWG